MSQISSAAPLRTAKRLAKQKDIRHVKSAIRWHERQRKQRQAIAADAFESKQTALSRIRWNLDHVVRPRRRALMDAREDWKLGPLRPNRAIGNEQKTYGALEQEDLRRPDIPVRVQKNRNEYLERKGREVETPLVVDDKKYFHIVRDDRVVVIRGREEGKIGVVQDVIEGSHEIVIKDLNKHYADSSIWNAPPGETPPPKRETEATLPIDDVRLVIPYRITTASGRETFQDVIVDKVIMERHTTGVDPFTGIDHGHEEFPAEHRYDPVTELPVFKRYIAGTRSLIQWPWEKDDEVITDYREAKKEETKEQRRIRDKLLHPLRTVSEYRKEQKEKQQAEANAAKIIREQDDKVLHAVEQEISDAASNTTKFHAKSKPLERPSDYDDDTGRNKVDPEEQTSRTFHPTLVYPPFPNQITDELAPHIREARWKDAKDKRMSVTQDVLERERLGREMVKNEEKMRKLETMKTPLQLRWEVQREQQLKERQEVDMDTLLAALGRHMIANRVDGKKLKRKGRKADIADDVE
ncbi:hypothetical protein CC80DRAFT_590628 [Byssothecium circinans]|uniref:KOW domain-containing protein n=1 Tax=Byssothecium circinans TaxID=147558 RepID=A0A6A5UBU7_9PLEO|nr:hypothetical protein CC80DRAFT_590628 [Byssothecium circinans]